MKKQLVTLTGLLPSRLDLAQVHSSSTIGELYSRYSSSAVHPKHKIEAQS